MPALPAKPTRRRNESAELTRPIVAALNAIPGIWASRNLTGSGFARAGHPITYGLGIGSADIVGCVAPVGRMFALEVKWPGKKPSKEQDAWRDRVAKLGVRVAVVHSVGQATELVRSWT